LGPAKQDDKMQHLDLRAPNPVLCETEQPQQLLELELYEHDEQGAADGVDTHRLLQHVWQPLHGSGNGRIGKEATAAAGANGSTAPGGDPRLRGAVQIQRHEVGDQAQERRDGRRQVECPALRKRWVKAAGIGGHWPHTHMDATAEAKNVIAVHQELCVPAKVIKAVHLMMLALTGSREFWQVVMMLRLVYAARRGVNRRQQADSVVALPGLHVPHGSAQCLMPHRCDEDDRMESGRPGER